MANVLGVGMLVAHQRPSCRAFLLGFEVFGAMALVFYVILASPSRRELVIKFFLDPLLNRLSAPFHN